MATCETQDTLVNRWDEMYYELIERSRKHREEHAALIERMRKQREDDAIAHAARMEKHNKFIEDMQQHHQEMMKKFMQPFDAELEADALEARLDALEKERSAWVYNPDKELNESSTDTCTGTICDICDCHKKGRKRPRSER